jgi:uncharacterized phage-associated protein
MLYDGRAIANFVLDHADRLGLQVTNLSLQKLVYFCHVWSLIELDRPLIRQKFEAWEYGPVLQYLYREFRVFGGAPINARARGLDVKTGKTDVIPYDLDDSTISLLRRVVEFYGRLGPRTLVELTHAPGGPWDKVWSQRRSINPGMLIDDGEIVRFYSRNRSRTPLQ